MLVTGHAALKLNDQTTMKSDAITKIVLVRPVLLDFVTRVIIPINCTIFVIAATSESHFGGNWWHGHLQKGVRYHQVKAVQDFVTFKKGGLNI